MGCVRVSTTTDSPSVSSLGEMATGVSLSLPGAHVHDIAGAERDADRRRSRAPAGRAASMSETRPSTVRSPGQVDPDVPVEGGAAAAVLVHERGRAAARTGQARTCRWRHAPRRTARSGRPACPARASDVAVGTGSSSAVWSTLIPIPITAIGGRVLTRSTRIPQTLRSPISTSLGHFSAGVVPDGPGDGVPRHQRDHRPPLGVDHRVEDGREGQRAPARRHPLRGRAGRGRPAGGRRPRPGGAPGRRQRARWSSRPRRAGAPATAGRRPLEGDLVERRPGGGGGVHGTRLAWQTRGGHT